MPIPDFITTLRRHVGTDPLWLIGVTAVVLRPAAGGTEEVLLVHRADTREWAPVGGIVEPGEETHVSVVREVREETCVDVEVERLVWVSTTDLVTHINGDQAWYLDHTFRCRWVAGDPMVGDDEATEVSWWPTSALPSMRPVYADRIRVVLADEPGTRLGRIDAPLG